jgi:hypothetical protein
MADDSEASRTEGQQFLSVRYLTFGVVTPTTRPRSLLAFKTGRARDLTRGRLEFPQMTAQCGYSPPAADRYLGFLFRCRAALKSRNFTF